MAWGQVNATSSLGLEAGHLKLKGRDEFSRTCSSCEICYAQLGDVVRIPGQVCPTEEVKHKSGKIGAPSILKAAAEVQFSGDVSKLVWNADVFYHFHSIIHGFEVVFTFMSPELCQEVYLQIGEWCSNHHTAAFAVE